MKNKKRRKGSHKNPADSHAEPAYLGTICVDRDSMSTSIPKWKSMKLIPAPGVTQGIVTHDPRQGGCGAHTIVSVRPESIGSPFSYTCSGCGKYLQFDRILERKSDPSAFHAFGDESTAQGLVLYGIVVLNDSDVMGASDHFAQVVQDAGVPPGTRFHCREVFSGHEREKSAWRIKGEYEMWEIARRLLVGLKEHRAMFCIGVVDVPTYPKEMVSWAGHGIKLQPEHLYGMAFQAAVGCLDAQGLVSPEVSLKLWTDPQESKINFWGGLDNRKVGQFFRHKHVLPEPLKGEKPLLLDAADLFAYIAGRALSPEPSRYKDNCRELYELCSPIRGDASWKPPPSVPVPGEDEFIRRNGRFCEWGWVNDPSCKRPEPFVAARVSTGAAARIQKKAKLDLKAPAFTVRIGDKVIGLILCLIRIEGLEETLVAPINHFSSYSKNPLSVVAQTKIFRVYLYEGKPEPSRQLKWTDMDVSSFGPVLDAIALLPSWTIEEFLAVLDTVQQTPEQLWDMFP